jgi:ribosome-binding protein aMBF1 (putative translation factor)
MAATGSLVQIEQIEQLEEVLRGLQQSTANTMLHEREAMSLSLREVSLKVRLTAAAINNIERGKSWRTKTARKIAEFYASLTEAA